MREVVFYGRLFLRLTVFGASDRKTYWQIEALFVFAMPAL